MYVDLMKEKDTLIVYHFFLVTKEPMGPPAISILYTFRTVYVYKLATMPSHAK